MNKFVVKIPKISTDLPRQRLRTVAVQMLGRKKGQTYQASWKGKYTWIVYDAAKKKVFCEVCTAAKNMDASLLSTAHSQESKSFCTGCFFQLGQSSGEISNSRKAPSNLHRDAVSTVAATNAGA